MAQYLIKCNVTLRGATMVIDAESEEDAMIKAEKHEWDDIEYNTAELADWTLTGKPEIDE